MKLRDLWPETPAAVRICIPGLPLSGAQRASVPLDAMAKRILFPASEYC
jgi:hypothetical protein